MGLKNVSAKELEKPQLRIMSLKPEETARALARAPEATDSQHFELTVMNGEIEGGTLVGAGDDGTGVLADQFSLNPKSKQFESSRVGFVFEEGVPVPRIDYFGRLLVTYQTGSEDLRVRLFDDRSCVDMGPSSGMSSHRLECYDASIFGAAKFVSLKVGDWNKDHAIDMAYVVDDPIHGLQTYLFQNKPIHEIAPEAYSRLWKVYEGLLADGVELDAHFIGRMRALGAKMVELEKKGEGAIVDSIMRKIGYAMDMEAPEDRLDFLGAILDVFELSGEDPHILVNVGIKRDVILYHNVNLLRLAGMFAKMRDKESNGSLKEAYLVNMLSGLYWYSSADMTRYKDSEYTSLVHSLASMGKGLKEKQLAGVHAAFWFGFLLPHKGEGTTPAGLASQIDEAMGAPTADGCYDALFNIFKGNLDLDADFLAKYSPFITASNLPTVEDLEVADRTIGPNDALLLYNKFNITRFARYHPSILAHLVKMAGDPNHMRDKPLVLIVTAQFDDTGMFHWGRRFEHDPNVRVVAVEVGSVGDFSYMLKEMTGIYGAPDSAMITAHGMVDGMFMGYRNLDKVRSESTGFLMQENGDAGYDYKNIDVISVMNDYDHLERDLGGVFGSARPQIVLNSCSTGKQPPDGKLNVAQMFANIFKTEVYAPEAVEGLLSLKVEVDDKGRARLNPFFAEVRGGPLALNDGGRRFVPQPGGKVTPRGLSRRQEESVSSSGRALPGSDRIPDLGTNAGRSRARDFFRSIFGR